MPFVEDYTHWLHLEERRVELRHNDSLWQSSHKLWNINISSYQMQRGSTYSIDVNSDTFKMISARLTPLEKPQFMHIVYNHVDELRVHLPRFKLSFLLAGGDILSDNMENMIVDSDNSSGTMIGLRRQLVLVQRRSYGLPSNRCVLIPFGRVNFWKEKGHVCVGINNPPEEKHIRYLTYSVNVDLQRLDGSGSLESTLYKVYLHALTSSCLPDPLTRRTGTVEALSLLYSAATMSFQRLQDKEKDLLLAIAQLTPRREYYPPHLKDMQTVHWLPLHALSQSEGFECRARQILSHAQRLKIFDDDGLDYSENMQPLSPLHLLERASARKQLFSASDSNWLAPSRDFEYHSRDTDLTDEGLVQAVSRAIIYRPNLNPRSLVHDSSIPPLLQSFKGWGNVANATRSGISYDRAFVEEEPASLLLPLFTHIVHRHTQVVSSALLFSICAFAYRKSNCSLVPYLVAFTIHPDFWSVSVPPWDLYDLSRGGVATAQQIKSCLTASVRQLNHTPSHKLQPLAGESPAQLQFRKESDYHLRCGQSLRSIVNKLIKQWPCQSPSIPPSTDYHDMSASSRTMRDLFQSWFSNDSLNQYLAFVQRTFDSVCSRATKQHSASTIQFAPCFVPKVHISEATTLSRIMCHRQAPSLGSVPGHFPHFPEVPYETMKNQSDRLSSMLDGLNLGDHPLQQSYLSLLQSSYESLLQTSDFIKASAFTSSMIDDLLPSLNTHYDGCSSYLEKTFQEVRSALHPCTVAEISLDISGRWPETSCRALMGMLSLNRWSAVPYEWQEILTVAATALVRYQQARRLLRFGMERRRSDLLKELQNGYIDVRKLQKCPDWLLIQVCIFQPQQRMIDLAHRLRATFWFAQSRFRSLKRWLLPRRMTTPYCNSTWARANLL